jgi:hypothetical protein
MWRVRQGNEGVGTARAGRPLGDRGLIDRVETALGPASTARSTAPKAGSDVTHFGDGDGRGGREGG